MWLSSKNKQNMTFPLKKQQQPHALTGNLSKTITIQLEDHFQIKLWATTQMPNLTQALQHNQESIAWVNRKCNHLSFPMIHEKCEVSQFTKRPHLSYMKSVNFPN